MAEITDQVRKAMRDDWCAHVDMQALEAQNCCNESQLRAAVSGGEELGK